MTDTQNRDNMKSYTDLEQSKKLAEFLSLESADMYYTPPLIKGHTDYIPHLKRKLPIDWDIEQKTPCWSLASLLNILPSSTLDSSNDHHYRLHCMERFTEWYDNSIDACYEMIIKLHELNLL